jgi:hypothetical protein
VETDVRHEGCASRIEQTIVRKSGQFSTATAFSGKFTTISAN